MSLLFVFDFAYSSLLVENGSNAHVEISKPLQNTTEEGCSRLVVGVIASNRSTLERQELS